MKKHLQLTAILLAIGAFLFAQEKTEVTMTIVKDGKVVKDTTYAFDDAKKAKHAVHMMDVMASDEDEMIMHKDHKVIVMSDGEMKKHDKHMMFISEDGEKVELIGEDSDKDVVWISEDDEDGNIKVTVKKIIDGDCEEGTKKMMKKEVYVISGEEGDWTVKEIKGDDGEVIVIKKKKGEGDEEEYNVEVIVKDKEMKEKEMMEQKKMVKKEEIEKQEKQKKKK